MENRGYKQSKSAFFLAAILLGSLVLGSGATAWAWRKALAPGFVGPDASGEETQDSKFQGGATLDNDPEVERLLHRAQQAVTDGRFDLSSVLLQKVLDGSSGMLVLRGVRDQSTPQFQYNKSVRDEIEQLLRSMPAEGLHVYRLTADGEARGLMAITESAERETALAELVRRFFLSSYGDDAAYELGCALLDRCEFIAASRLFTKILNDHPDPSVPKEHVLLRLALANARLGDSERTKSALASLDAIRPSRLPPGMSAMVKQEVLRGPHRSVEESVAWRMAYGTPARDGQMPALRDENFKSDLVEAVLSKSDMPPATVNASAIRSARINYSSRPAPGPPQPLSERWAKSGWTPAGQLLVESDRIYFKTLKKQSDNKTVELVRCISAISGDLIFDTQSTRTQYDATLTQWHMQMRGMMPQVGDRPSTLEEVMAFGDRVRQSMSIVDGVLYQLEGADLDDPDTSDQVQYGPNGMPTISTKNNWIAAYRTHGSKPNTGGKLLWRRMGDEDKTGGKTEVRFVNAPVACGNVLVVPAREGGGLWLYAIDPAAQGRTVWRTFLCDEARGGVNPWSPVGLSVDGGDVYVASGSGAVFSVDGASGAVRWGTQYERSPGAPINPQQMGFGMNPNRLGLGAKGWDEDTVIAHGRALLLLPSDAEYIFAFDRRTGDLLWLTPKEGEGVAKYCLGLADEALFVAGGNCVRRYNIVGGKLVWSILLDSVSHGRGALTTEALYIPVNGATSGAVAKIDLKTGKVLAQVGVQAPEGERVGNLFTNGEHFFVAGPDRVSLLADARSVAPEVKEGEKKADETKPAADKADSIVSGEEKSAAVKPSEVEKPDDKTPGAAKLEEAKPEDKKPEEKKPEEKKPEEKPEGQKAAEKTPAKPSESAAPAKEAAEDKSGAGLPAPKSEPATATEKPADKPAEKSDSTAARPIPATTSSMPTFAQLRTGFEPRKDAR